MKLNMYILSFGYAWRSRPDAYRITGLIEDDLTEATWKNKQGGFRMHA